MVELNKQDLQAINGGGAGIAIAFGLIAAGIAFLIGVFDGYVRPYKCRS